MKISARNQLRGTVETVHLGVVTAKVGVRIGENLIESVITKQSVEELNIKVGSEVHRHHQVHRSDADGRLASLIMISASSESGRLGDFARGLAL